MAPLSDVATGLAYRRNAGSPRLGSMSVSGTFDLNAIDGDHWRRLGDAVAADGDRLAEKAGTLQDQAPAAFEEAASDVDDWDGGVRALLARLMPRLTRSSGR